MIVFRKHTGFLFFSTIIAIAFLPIQKTFAQVPENPEIDSVSIVDESPIISWFPNEINTTGYSVYRGRYETAGGNTFLIFDSLTSLPGVQQTSFIDAQVSGCFEQRLYKIRAYNDMQASNWLVADTMNTILITAIDFDLCSNTVFLEWTKYRNMRDGLGGYRILASVDGGDYEIVGTTDASQNNFIHDNLLPEVQYSYKIRAFSEDESRTSTSCEKSVETETYDRPLFSEIDVATVENFEHVKITWDTDDAPVSRFRIMRSENGSTYSMIGDVVDTINHDPDGFFTDTSAKFNEQSYYYRIDVFDFCDKQELSSENITRTIHLSAQKGSGLSIDLDWNAYEGWDEISEYEIYREVDGTLNPSGPLETLSDQETDFNDDISELTAGEGKLAYYVKAIEGGGGNRESFSNKVTIELETSIRIPNAILPESSSPDEREFKPVLDFIEEGFYEMVIFNKWGQQLFVSNNQDDGWTGRYNGEIVPAGTYVYVIKFRNARGELVEKQGTVTVIR